MSTRVATVIDIAPPSVVDAAPAWTLPDRGKVAMASLIIAESAIFTIFVVAYLFYIGKSISGPTPRDVLETPIFYTICLLSSSFTIHYAGKVLERGRSEEHTSELQSLRHLVCRHLLEKKKKNQKINQKLLIH